MAKTQPAAAPVALRALSAAVDSSTCFLISTLLLRELSRNQVSKKTLGRRTWTLSQIQEDRVHHPSPRARHRHWSTGSATCSSPTPGLRHRAIASVQVPAPRGSVRTPVTLASAMSSAPSTQTAPCPGLRAHPTGPAGTGAPSAARPHPAPVQTPTGSHRDPSGPARAHVRNGRGLDRCPTPPRPTTPWGRENWWPTPGHARPHGVDSTFSARGVSILGGSTRVRPSSAAERENNAGSPRDQ